MESQRPNPDILLDELNLRNKPVKGKLKIFFGYAAGVGKTYAMLEAAHEAISAGVDCIAGYIEPHTRPATLNLLHGIVQIPVLMVEYKGVKLREFDLDKALDLKPQLILVDELAHTNAQTCRHRKRFQDIEELLNAGIDVYTTVNVQHIESLNDIVASITGVHVQERIPDSVFDHADQVELVDIEPDDLIKRLNKGKIYQENQAKKALNNFFIPENLIALREIALRRTADRVNRRSEKYQTINKHGYYTEEHILICLSSAPSNTKVIRTAARMAEAFHGTFTALFVETTDFGDISDDDKKRLRNNLKLAEDLGANIAAAYGDDVPEQIAEFAKSSSVSKVVIGRSNHKKSWIKKSTFVDQLTELAPNIDIYVIPDTQPSYSKKRISVQNELQFSLKDAISSLIILGVCSLIGYWFFELNFTDANIIMVYILGVLITAMVTTGRIYSAVFSIVGVLLFNFLFTEPRFTFNAYDIGYSVTFIIMLAASLVVSSLTIRIKKQAIQAARKAYRTQILLETSQKLQMAQTHEDIVQATALQLRKLFKRTVLFYPVEGSETNADLKSPRIFLEDGDDKANLYIRMDEQAVAQWVFKNNKHAGATTNTLPVSMCLYMAVRGHDSVYGVAAIAMGEGDTIDAFEKNLMVAMLSECGLALEKITLSDEKKRIEVQAKQEQLRANLLRAISHDLRTPLTSISGNAAILLENSKVLDEAKKHSLYEDVYDDSMWLINLVENLLSVTRIENGTMHIHTEAELLDEVFQEALEHTSRKSYEHTITTNLQDDLLMAQMDAHLIIQVIINIVDNAIKYTDAGSHIELSARRSNNDMVLIEIKDDGPGIKDDAKVKLFDMYYTAGNHRGDSRRGLGLGLSLCKSIIHAHDGELSVRDNEPQGTIFSFTLRAQEVNMYE